MKRYASHFLFLPKYGFLKQYVIEIEGGRIERLFPLSEEVESTEWLPGVIALLQPNQHLEIATLFEQQPLTVLSTHPSEVESRMHKWIPYLFFPFDFITMQPVVETQHRPLL